MKNKLRSGSFWATLVGALALIFANLGWEGSPALAEKIASAVASVLLLAGVISSPAKTDPSAEDSEQNKDENSQQK